MISQSTDNLFDLKVDALAHGCNTQGIMNAGISREFRERYPKMYKEYRDYCKSGNFNVGDVHFYESREEKPHVINIAVQFDTHTGAILEYIEGGLLKIEELYRGWEIKSLGIPHIGCGLGNLKWGDVREVVRKIFGTSDLEVIVTSGRKPL